MPDTSSDDPARGCTQDALTVLHKSTAASYRNRWKIKLNHAGNQPAAAPTSSLEPVWCHGAPFLPGKRRCWRAGSCAAADLGSPDCSTSGGGSPATRAASESWSEVLAFLLPKAPLTPAGLPPAGAEDPDPGAGLPAPPRQGGCRHRPTAAAESCRRSRSARSSARLWRIERYDRPWGVKRCQLHG